MPPPSIDRIVRVAMVALPSLSLGTADAPDLSTNRLSVILLNQGGTYEPGMFNRISSAK